MRSLAATTLLTVLLACSSGETEIEVAAVQDTMPDLGRVRGVILISLDTLRADRLGTYGYAGDTSPFLDQLAAERGIVFERAIAQYPGTLISHMSMLTGLYPQEHGVMPPASVLSPEVPLLAEMLSDAGVLTAGHTEGGFMDGDFGFARGFRWFTDTPYADDTDIERTFERGIEFLWNLREVARQGHEHPTKSGSADPTLVIPPFFVFLHTYSIHDPYDPPEGFGVEVDDTLEPPPTGETLKLANDGFLTVPGTVVAAYSARYDASIRYVDSVLSGFFDRLDTLGLSDDTAVIITSDHGEAFGEHDRLGHEQTYPEELQVPLILIHPHLDRGVRMATPAELIDVTPTVLALLGVEGQATGMPTSGRSLLSERQPRPVHAVNSDPTRNRVLQTQDGDRTWMLVETEYLADPDGTWLPLDHAFDVDAPATLEVLAFNGPKDVTVTVDDQDHDRVEVPGAWTQIAIVGEGRRRIRLLSTGCTSPRLLGVGDDPRCLSLKLRGEAVRRLELFELSSDPGASIDLSREEPQRLRRMLSELESVEFLPRATAADAELDEETRKTLETLGYL